MRRESKQNAETYHTHSVDFKKVGWWAKGCSTYQVCAISWAPSLVWGKKKKKKQKKKVDLEKAKETNKHNL
jgi:hypothetical protein